VCSRGTADCLNERLDAAIEEHAFSGVVSVRRLGAVLYERAAGFADRSHGIENTLGTRFGMASGSKFFTALVIGLLMEDGELSFSTPLRDCVDRGLPPYSEEITIRHLLTHTSGIPDYYDEDVVTDFDSFMLSIPGYELRGPRDYLPAFPDGPMKFAPGERFSYCNSGYVLLGVVIEEVTGQAYQDAVEERLLRPAGMMRSGYFAFDRLPEETAWGYIEEEGGWRTNVFNLPIIGGSDGGAFSTVGDLALLWDAFWGCQILSKEMVEIFTQPFARAGKHKHYGHGLWIYEEPGQDREEYLEGSDAGVSFFSGTNRAKGLQTTVISNTSHGAWPVLKAVEAALAR
jgi:CubicO group peptidase (beta-lactamase class C family)